MIKKCSQVLCLSPAMNSSLKLCCFKKQQIGAVQRVLASVRVRTRERACTLFYVYFYFSTCIADTCRDVSCLHTFLRVFLLFYVYRGYM